MFADTDCSVISSDWRSYGSGLCAWISEEKATWVDAVVSHILIL